MFSVSSTRFLPPTVETGREGPVNSASARGERAGGQARQPVKGAVGARRSSPTQSLQSAPSVCSAVPRKSTVSGQAAAPSERSSRAKRRVSECRCAWLRRSCHRRLEANGGARRRDARRQRSSVGRARSLDEAGDRESNERGEEHEQDHERARPATRVITLTRAAHLYPLLDSTPCSTHGRGSSTRSNRFAAMCGARKARVAVRLSVGAFTALRPSRPESAVRRRIALQSLSGTPTGRPRISSSG